MKKSFFLSALCLMNVALMAEDYELRTLTFEDADAQFAPYTLDYANRTIATWSDLVDDAQYNGTLTYTTGGVYTWCDEGNTLLTHRFTAPYWGGGHAISNFTIPGYSNDHLPANTAWYELQFATLHGGNNGSKNFCVHNGHVDDYNSAYTTCQTIAFADGKARVLTTCMSLISAIPSIRWCMEMASILLLPTPLLSTSWLSVKTPTAMRLVAHRLLSIWAKIA